jgi:hypothetical protein
MAMPGEAGMGALTEDCSGRIVTGETGLAHTRTVNCQLESIIWLYLARCCRGLVAFGDVVGAAMRIAPLQQGWRVLGFGGVLTHCR